jgi:2-methylcitrate dehydratase PrpD
MCAETDRFRPSNAIATFVGSLEYDDLPEQLVTIGENAFVDTTGTVLAGVGSTSGDHLKTFVDTDSVSDGPAPVFGTTYETSLQTAVFANTTAGHLLDYDDSSLMTHNHPSVPIVPGLLTAASIRSVSGKELLAAYAAGVETQYVLAQWMDLDSHVEGGWHATSTLGTFGATSAFAHLYGLDIETITTALNIAASFPSGLKINFGTGTKPIHAGHAARSGLVATLMAQSGATAAEEALGAAEGFVGVYASSLDESAVEQYDPGDWLILDDETYHLKKYPCCACSHAGVAATISLAEKHDIGPAVVDAIEVIAPDFTREELRYPEPSTEMESKFSMEYTIARALLDRTVSLDTFAAEQLDSSTAERIRQCVTYETTESVSFGEYRTTVRIHTTEGTTYETTKTSPPGTHADPLSTNELETKFVRCSSVVLPEESCSQLFDALSTLRDRSDVRPLINGLTV